MRRWLVVFAVAALAVTVVALPSSAEDKSFPDPVEFTSGTVRYGAIEARTGEYAGEVGFNIGGVPGWNSLMDPNYNMCLVEQATLTWIGKNTAELLIHEDCSPRGMLPGPEGHKKLVHITNGGALKMSPLQYSNHPMLWSKVPMMTGCDLNGTFPIYHGHFKNGRLYASAHYNSICDGGTVWSNFGISAEDGPIHVTYEFELFTD